MRRLLPVFALIATTFGCAKKENQTAIDTAKASAAKAETTSAAPSAMAGGTVTAAMQDAAGHDLGTLTITQTDSSLKIAGMLHGLPPGTHGIHIHSVGQCQPPTFESAGPHWNPANKKHGLQNPQGPHMGDAPNITVGADSTASVSVTTPPGGTLRGTNPLLDADGASVVIHAKADDEKTDPSGNSGARIACGVVRAS
jgi:superoxide dismutase, Cu-Zn family